MTKVARADHPILDIIAKRWSPRSFAPREVEDTLLLSIFEAARWAPSSRNEQPWRFIVGRKGKDETYPKLLACLVGANQRWAQAAPVLALAVAKRTHTASGRPNRWAWHDVGLSVATLLLQTVALGLYGHPMAGFDAARAVETFGIPEDFEPVLAIALGYLGDPEALPQDLRAGETRPRERRPLAETIFTEHWGEAPDWVKPKP
ncbi:MAG: nitroreductase family protein [Chloroflexi bacterium]|nr:nitroreductase family protein [Chloroflexota bacterium]